ncbi:methyltransferase [Acinetobacter sp. M5A5_2a]
MHFFHPTPLDIVDQYIASKTKGKHFDKVLDPCVGDGALLTSLKNNFNSITIVDIDTNKLNNFQNSNFIKYSGDFLEIDFTHKFDLILCNPPFNNKSVQGQSIEEKFLKKCLKLIKNNGYGIFILPSSIINGTKSNKIRENLINNYTILSIDILPKRTFTKIESHFYIITLKNTRPSKSYKFKTNMGIIESTCVAKNNYSTLNPKNLINISIYEKLLQNFKTFDLSKELIFRGNIEKKYSQLHTTNFSSFICIKNINIQNNNGKKIKKHDLLCKRVGRNCADSFSIFLSKDSVTISDCIIVLPSKSQKVKDNLIRLLNLRISILFGASYNFKIDGSGANYISMTKFKHTKFIDFKDFFSKKDIKKFHYLLIKKDLHHLKIFEKDMQNKIQNKFLIEQFL